jgi:uncharacterized RDD family membrane protein YckC
MAFCDRHPAAPSTRTCSRCNSAQCEVCTAWFAQRGFCPSCPLANRPPARLTLRVLAHLIDGAVLVVPAVLAQWAGMLIAARNGAYPRSVSQVPIGEGLGLMGFVAVFLSACVAQIVWQVALGRSFGKWLLGLRVLQSDGQIANVLQVVLLRNAIPYVLYGACGIPGLVDLVMFGTAPHRRLHDRFANTSVVEDPRI